jgi:ATP-dependent Clp protease ATP-binding subunit ClpX
METVLLDTMYDLPSLDGVEWDQPRSHRRAGTKLYVHGERKEGHRRRAGLSALRRW